MTIYNPDTVRYMSQELGLNDRQISEKLNCQRATITKLRKRYDIPTCNINNRKDKTYICATCNKKVFIKRKERRKAVCDECAKKIK